jgi:hypothetical protein
MNGEAVAGPGLAVAMPQYERRRSLLGHGSLMLSTGVARKHRRGIVRIAFRSMI